MNFSALHPFDIILAVIGLLFVVIGMYRGLIHEAFRLLAVFAGFAVAIGFYRRIYYHIGFLPISDSARLVAGFIVLFLGGVLGVLLLGWAVEKVVHLTVLGWVDRLFGGIFGLLKILLVAWIFVRSAESSPFTSQKQSLRQSYTYRLLASVPPKLTLPYLRRHREAIRMKMGKNPLEEVSRAKKTLEQFREKVDSAKAVRERLREAQ